MVGRADASAVTAQEGRRQFDAIRATLAELDASERRELLQRRAQSADLRERSIVTAELGLAVLLALDRARSPTAPCAAVVDPGRPPAGLRARARRAPLRRRLPESGPPETVELAQAFNATAVSLEAAEAELRRIGERHLAELDAVFRRGAARARVRGPRAALPAGQRRAGGDERPDRRRARRQARAATGRGRRAANACSPRGSRCSTSRCAVDGRRFEASYFPVRAGGDARSRSGPRCSTSRPAAARRTARERLQHATADARRGRRPSPDVAR